jgi:4-hydroxy-tetrahydrodipicolinate synthase
MANIVPGLVKAMIDNGANSEARMRSAIDAVADAPSFTAALKAVLAAQTGDAGWLRVRPPLRPPAGGASLKAKLDALMSPAIA